MQLLCNSNEIKEGESKGFTGEGYNLFVVHYRGQFYIYNNSCPHRHIPLEWSADKFLDYEKTFIQCATHGALFKIDSGECISGPCINEQLSNIPFKVENGQIFLID